MFVHHNLSLMSQRDLLFLEDLRLVIVFDDDFAQSFFLWVFGMASIEANELLDLGVVSGNNFEALIHLFVLLSDLVLHKGDLVWQIRRPVRELIEHSSGILIVDGRHIGIEGCPWSQTPRIPVDGQIVSGHDC